MEKWLSLTAMTKELKIKHPEIKRDTVLAFLVQEGLVYDIRQITDKGRHNGVAMKVTDKGEKYPVYNSSVQKMVDERAESIIREFGGQESDGQKSGGQESKAKANQKKDPGLKTPKTYPGKYKYLGIDNFLILDTETTGLEEDDEVIELAIVDMDGYVLYQQRFCPEKEVNLFAAKVNHLSKRMLEKEPKFSDCWPFIAEILNGRWIMGHNIPFDARLILQTLKKQGKISEKGMQNSERLLESLIDTKTIAKKHIKTDHYSLDALTTKIGITRPEQHEAADDCIMTLEFVNRLEEILEAKYDYSFVK